MFKIRLLLAARRPICGAARCSDNENYDLRLAAAWRFGGGKPQKTLPGPGAASCSANRAASRYTFGIGMLSSRLYE